jgi:hypothetical protein
MKSSAMLRPAGTDLSNWRSRPYNTWSYQNVRALIPTANIAAAKEPTPLTVADNPVAPVVAGSDVLALLGQFETDCIVILKGGKKVWQWSAPYCVFNQQIDHRDDGRMFVGERVD